jgi:hypothetical protein
MSSSLVTASAIIERRPNFLNMHTFSLPSAAAGLIPAPHERAASGLSMFSSDTQRERLLSGLLQWLLDNIAMFDPPQEDEVDADAPEAVMPDRSRKAFGELGAALRLAWRVPALKARVEVAELRSAWLALARKRNIFFDARRRIWLFPHRAVALAVLSELGEASVDVKRALQNVLDRGWMDRTERSAWQKLDLKYYFDAAGLRHVFPDDESLFLQSSLATLPSLPYVTRSDLYGVTHLVFHLADFGRVDLNPIGGASRCRALADFVQGALAMCLHERDYDLVAELMINRLCLKRGGDALDRHAADALCEVQDPTGFLPDLAWLAGLPPESDASLQGEAKFFAVYHPTVVGLFLVATDMDCEQAGVERI